MKPLDIFFLALSLALTLGSAWAVFQPSKAEPRLEIQTDEGLFTYPLNHDQSLTTKGPLGLTHITIQAGQVWVHDSPCTNHVCLSMGKIHQGGQWISCLPNHIFVRIVGNGAAAEGIDAHVY